MTISLASLLVTIGKSSIISSVFFLITGDTKLQKRDERRLPDGNTDEQDLIQQLDGLFAELGAEPKCFAP